MIRVSGFWPTLILISALAVGLLTMTSIASPLRPMLALWFLLVCPGMAFVRLLHLRDSLAEWTLAVALSFALDALVVEIMLYSGLWSPKWGLAVLIGLSMAGAILQIRDMKPQGMSRTEVS
jgi:uncharacterized membrane protein